MEEAEMETAADNEMVGWEWVSGDSIHVDIPVNEQMPEAASDETTRTRRLRPRAKVSSRVPNLSGKSLEAVEEEASRIKLGEYFTSFAEFDRCLHSWCVLNGRGAARFKTQANMCVRTCRFGKCRIPWCPSQSPVQEQNENQPSTGPNHDPHDLNETPLHGEESDLGWHFQDGEWTLSESDPAASSGPTHAPKARAPLQSIDHNTVGVAVNQNPDQNQMSLQSQALNKAPPSIVQHTSVWLPGSQSKRGSTQASKVIRQQSQTGACGQLARFQPSPEEPNNNSPEDIPCPFRVRCQRHVKTGRCHITICDLHHTCPQVRHKWRGPTKKAHWLGETLAPRVTRNVKVPVKELVDGFQSDYYKTTSYHQMWRSKDLVRDWYLGGQRKSFHQIPSLLRTLTEVDVGCIVDWSTEYNSDIFKRAFICPSATRAALQFCQPVVSLDACHTKNRKFPTQLFLATVLDGNSQVLILCYGVAPVENSDNWSWFLEQLQRAIHGVADPQIAFVSDQQKGLVAAVKEVFPGKVHAACANVKTNYGKAAAQFFLGCVYANNKKLYDDILDRLVASIAKGVAAKEYIENINPEVYARHAFPLPRMGRVTSNPVEQANSGLLPLRDFAPFRLLVELWYYVQARFNDRRMKANRSSAIFTKQATNHHNVKLKTYGQWKIFEDGGDEAKIENASHTEQYLVKLSPCPTCTCFETQEMCWPCQHIMAWDSKDGRDFSLRFHKCWRISSLRLLYEPLLPCFLSYNLGTFRWCCPHEIAVQKGRHRVVRLRAGAQSRRSTPLGANERIDSLGNYSCCTPFMMTLREWTQCHPQTQLQKVRQRGGVGQEVPMLGRQNAVCVEGLGITNAVVRKCPLLKVLVQLDLSHQQQQLWFTHFKKLSQTRKSWTL